MFNSFDSTRDRELKFCMSKYLQKMYLETKFQPFLLINAVRKLFEDDQKRMRYVVSHNGKPASAFLL